MSFVAKLAKQFEQERLLFANVLVNERLTPLTLQYEPQKITINNLGEDFPPLLRIWRDTKKIEASVDRVKWLPLEEHEEKELQIYLILDPAFLLPHVAGEKTTENGPAVMVDGWYRIDELPLPEAFVGYFTKEENLRRWMKLFAIGNRLLSISQQDFPPHKDTITLLFEGISPYFRPIFRFRTRP